MFMPTAPSRRQFSIKAYSFRHSCPHSGTAKKVSKTKVLASGLFAIPTGRVTSPEKKKSQPFLATVAKAPVRRKELLRTFFFAVHFAQLRADETAIRKRKEKKTVVRVPSCALPALELLHFHMLASTDRHHFSFRDPTRITLHYISC